MVRFAMRGFRLVSFVLAAYWLLIFIGTHIPHGNLPVLHQSDKVLHFTAFMGLAFLLAWAFPKESKRPNAHLWGALLVAMVYGATDELSQIPVGRTADIADWIADTLGACTGVAIFFVLRPIWSNLRKRWKSVEPTTTNLSPLKEQGALASIEPVREPQRVSKAIAPQTASR